MPSAEGQRTAEPSPAPNAEAWLASNDPDLDLEATAHLPLLTPEAHAAFTGPPNGPAHAYLRRPDGSWSAPLAVRPPRFDTPATVSLPVCTGWCIGCGGASRWRADPTPGPGASVTRWCCTRCAADEKADHA